MLTFPAKTVICTPSRDAGLMSKPEKRTHSPAPATSASSQTMTEHCEGPVQKAIYSRLVLGAAGEPDKTQRVEAAHILGNALSYDRLLAPDPNAGVSVVIVGRVGPGDPLNRFVQRPRASANRSARLDVHPTGTVDSWPL